MSERRDSLDKWAALPLQQREAVIHLMRETMSVLASAGLPPVGLAGLTGGELARAVGVATRVLEVGDAIERRYRFEPSGAWSRAQEAVAELRRYGAIGSVAEAEGVATIVLRFPNQTIAAMGELVVQRFGGVAETTDGEGGRS